MARLPAANNRLKELLPIFIIIILGCIVYSNSLHGEFIWDDLHLVKDNAYLDSWSNLVNIFKGNIGSGARIEYDSYRPLQIVTYLIDRALWGKGVFGYHLTSAFLHILVSLLIYWLITILFKDNTLAALTACLFTVHPVHVEAVSYISGRADILAALFMLLSLILYIKGSDTKNPWPYLASVLSYAAAILSRENSLIFPILILLYHYSFKIRFPWKKLVPYVGVITLYAIARIWVLNTSMSAIPSTTCLERIPGFLIAMCNYMRLLVAPANLHMEYGNTVMHFSDPKAFIGLVIIIALITLAIMKRKGDTIIFFSIGWFFATIMPSSNIYPINAYMAEHWLYLPSIGFFLIIAKYIRHIDKKGLTVIAVSISAALIVFYSYLTIRQNDYWRDPIRFYKRTLYYAPESHKSCYNLAMIYKDEGRNDEAIELFTKAIKANPRYSEAYNNLGSLHGFMGNYAAAESLFKKAIELNPRYARAYNNMANVYMLRGHYKEAIKFYEKALEFDPKQSDTRYNLDIAYETLRKNR